MWFRASIEVLELVPLEKQGMLGLSGLKQVGGAACSAGGGEQLVGQGSFCHAIPGGNEEEE